MQLHHNEQGESKEKNTGISEDWKYPKLHQEHQSTYPESSVNTKRDKYKENHMYMQKCRENLESRQGRGHMKCTYMTTRETAEFSPKNLWNSKVVTEEKMSTHGFTLMNEGEVHLQTHEGWEQLLPPLQDAEGRWRAKDRTRKEPRQKWRLHEIKHPLYSGNTDCRKGKL